MNAFQTAVLIIFGFVLIIGVLIFAGVLPGFRAPSGGVGGEVVWWGTLPARSLQTLLLEFNEQHKKEFSLTYVEKNSQTLEAELVEALASGAGPDLVTLPQELIVRQEGKLAPWPEEVLSRRQFQDTFLNEGDLWLSPAGARALPLYVDPLVMYFNPDLTSRVRLARPPVTWNELEEAMARGLVTTDETGNILSAAIALGQFSNIVHAKDILTTLIMQTGNDLVTWNERGERQATLGELLGFPEPPAAAALEFFNRFADPANGLYSWNIALPEPRDMFAGGTLAFYLGYASEAPRLREQNPQLVFDAALVPQRAGAARHLTFGRLYAVGVLNQAKNRQTAFTVAYTLTGAEFAAALSKAIGLPPARTDLLAALPLDPLQTVFYQSAVIAKAWFDPAPAASGQILARAAAVAQSGQSTPAEAVLQAQRELASLFNPTDQP